MKTFSDGKNHDDARQKARGCLVSNLALPGLGSLAGGRKVGVLQLAVCLSGFALSLIFGVRFIFWSLAHWSELHDPNGDPIAALSAMLSHLRWPFLGFILVAVAWGWAFVTSRALLAEAEKNSGG